MGKLPHATGGSSGQGISFYKTAMKCPRKANLISQAKKEGHVGNGSRASRVGTYFHGIASLYYSGDYSACELEVTDVNYQEDFNEAQRLWNNYLATRPGKNYFGKVLAVERELSGPKMEAVFGVPLSAQLDLVVDMSAEVCEKLEESDNLTLKPGIYIIDHKTKSKRDPNALSSYRRNMQFIGYQLIWQHVMEEEVQGMLANVIIGHKTMRSTDGGPRKPRSFDLHLVEYPDEHEEEVFRSFLTNAHMLAKTNLPLGLANGCGDYGVCSFLEDGSCDRK